MLTALNHLTLAVTDLPRSLDFYTQVLGCRLHALGWGAYLTLGSLWICLSSDAQRVSASSPPDYTHYAFSLSQGLRALCGACQVMGVREWKSNRSEGDSFYFLDPDGHRWKPMWVRWRAGWRNAGCSPMRACSF
jgi:catechol 2,3-dioxygenase-like lactoylglutathione lyase family enzyme